MNLLRDDDNTKTPIKIMIDGKDEEEVLLKEPKSSNRSPKMKSINSGSPIFRTLSQVENYDPQAIPQILEKEVKDLKKLASSDFVMLPDDGDFKLTHE